MRRGL